MTQYEIFRIMKKVQFLILAQLINLLSYTAIGQDVSFDKLVLTSGEEKIKQGGSRDQKLGIKIQSDCYNVLKKYADQFLLQDPITTNALLIKHNISEESIMGFTPSELTNILDAEYIIYGNVTVNDKGSTSGNANYATGKSKGNKYTGILFGSSSTTRLFTTTVDMKIYTDLGQNIFGQSHESFWQTENAYEVTLQYLIKRTPLYRK